MIYVYPDIWYCSRFILQECLLLHFGGIAWEEMAIFRPKRSDKFVNLLKTIWNK